MTVIFCLSFLIAAVISLSITPVVMKLAFAIGAVDKPDERKIHKRVMPRLGGVAAFGSFAATLVALHFIFPMLDLEEVITDGKWELVAASFVIILTLGVCDDVWTLRAGKKFLVQLLAGALVYSAGFRISQITNPFSGGLFKLGILAFPLTVFWVVGITNAFNLIDGLDGLASGISLIAGLSIVAISIFHHDIQTAAVALALVGAVFGFLRYNFNPAKIFLGDSGSLFLGFTLAILSIESSTKGSTAFSLIVPILVLGVPIMDTILAMIRRVLRSFMPDDSSRRSPAKKLRSMFVPDRRHIHHQLMATGLSHRDAVIVLYIASCAFGLGAFLVTAGSLSTLLLLVAVAIIAEFGVRKLGYREMAFIRNGLLLRLYSNTFLRSSIAQIVLDTFSVFGAFIIARLFVTPGHIFLYMWRNWAFAFVIVSTIQLFAFIVGGLYKRNVSLFGLGDMLQVLKATFVGVIATGVALMFLPVFPSDIRVGLFVLLDFYFLTTMVAGSRVVFHALNYVFHRETVEGKRSIIYGADRNGLITLQFLLSQGNSRGCSPAGFLDDNPKLEGKYLDGYPIFGGHWKLESLLRKMDVMEIVLASQDMNSIVLDRIRKTASGYNIPLRHSEMKFDNVGTEAMQSNSAPAYLEERTPKAA